jgi:hypothetical protein
MWMQGVPLDKTMKWSNSRETIASSLKLVKVNSGLI